MRVTKCLPHQNEDFHAQRERTTQHGTFIRAIPNLPIQINCSATSATLATGTHLMLMKYTCL